MTIPYVLSDGTLTLHLQGRPHPIDRSQPNWDAIIAALGKPETTEAELLPLVSVKTYVEGLQIGKVKVGEDTIFYDRKPVHNHLTNRMLEIVKAGLPVEPWAKFMDSLHQNPSNTAVTELYLWLEQSKMPITDDGHFLAYKKVRDDYTSFHRGPNNEVVHNDIGSTPSMPRNQVDDQRDNTCSHGLHFCSWDYLPSYYGGQGKVVVLKINPADVVSIPSDYNNAKGRAWQYLVWDEVDQEQARFAFEGRPVVATSEGWDEQDSEIDEEDEISSAFDEHRSSH
jgi:hypothetical protein